MEREDEKTWIVFEAKKPYGILWLLSQVFLGLLKIFAVISVGFLPKQRESCGLLNAVPGALRRASQFRTQRHSHPNGLDLTFQTFFFL